MGVAFFSKRGKRSNNYTVPGFSVDHYRRIVRGVGCFIRRVAKSTQWGGEHDEQYHVRRLLNSCRGSILAIETIFMLGILTFLVFGMIDYGVLFVKHQYAQHEMYYYLQRMRVEGQLTTADETQMASDFQDFSCPVSNLNGTYPRQSQGQSPVVETPGNVSGSEVTLGITCTPQPQPFWTSTLIGGTGATSFQIKVGGSMLSEYTGS